LKFEYTQPKSVKEIPPDLDIANVRANRHPQIQQQCQVLGKELGFQSDLIDRLVISLEPAMSLEPPSCGEGKEVSNEPTCSLAAAIASHARHVAMNNAAIGRILTRLEV
jgi:hypothetical protein